MTKPKETSRWRNWLAVVPAIAAAEVLLITDTTVPARSLPRMVPLGSKVAPLLIVTPLAMTLSVFKRFRLAFKA